SAFGPPPYRSDPGGDSGPDFERRRVQAERAGPGDETEYREGRIELEAPRGKIEPAGSAVMVVLEQFAEHEKVQRQQVPRRVPRRVVPVAVAVTATVDDCGVDRASHPMHRQEQELPQG